MWSDSASPPTHRTTPPPTPCRSHRPAAPLVRLRSSSGGPSLHRSYFEALPTMPDRHRPGGTTTPLLQQLPGQPPPSWQASDERLLETPSLARDDPAPVFVRSVSTTNQLLTRPGPSHPPTVGAKTLHRISTPYRRPETPTWFPPIVPTATFMKNQACEPRCAAVRPRPTRPDIWRRPDLRVHRRVS